MPQITHLFGSWLLNNLLDNLLEGGLAELYLPGKFCRCVIPWSHVFDLHLGRHTEQRLQTQLAGTKKSQTGPQLVWGRKWLTWCHMHPHFHGNIALLRAHAQFALPKLGTTPGFDTGYWWHNIPAGAYSSVNSVYSTYSIEWDCSIVTGVLGICMWIMCLMQNTCKRRNATMYWEVRTCLLCIF